MLLLALGFGLLVAAGALYLHLAGLPGFLKNRIVAELRHHGVDLQFSRMKLRGLHSVAADDVRVHFLAQTNGPVLVAARSTFSWKPALLSPKRFRLTEVTLRDAEVTLPSGEPNAAPLELKQIHARLHFSSAGELQVRSFRAQWNSVEIDLTLHLAHPAAIRDWPFWSKPKPGPERGPALDRWIDALDRVEFSQPPTLSLRLSVDARNLQTVEAEVQARAPGAIRTPWGGGTDLLFSMHASHPFSQEGSARLHFELDGFQAEQGRGDSIRLQTDCQFGDGFDHPITATSFLTVGRIAFERAAETNQVFHARDLALDARTIHSFTNRWPLQANAAIQFASAGSPWGQSDRVEVSFSADHFEDTVFPPGEEIGFWNRLERFAGNWKGTARAIRAPNIQIGFLQVAGEWRAPQLLIDKFDASLHGGKVLAKGELDVLTRVAQVNASSDFDAHQISFLLTTNGRRWLSQFEWEQPPATAARIQATLPAWTNRQPDWRGEVVPTLVMRGHFSSGPGAFRSVPVLSARSLFFYSNMVWNLPDLEALRPEGSFHLHYSANERTREYYFDITSQIDPRAARPLVEEEEARKAFEYVEFLSPPLIRAEVWGRWEEHDAIGARGEIVATNFVFRGNHIDSLSTSIAYTNLFLTLTDARVDRGGDSIDAPRAEFDIGNQIVWLSGVVSTMDPQLVTRAIGPVIAKAVDPYRFLVPPLVKVDGKFSTTEVELAELTFQVEGEQFRWGPFSAEHASGLVLWTGETLVLTNLSATAYSGQLTGSAFFDFSVEEGAALSFAGGFRDVDLQSAVLGLGLTTNRLEGWLDGQGAIVSGNTEDLGTWEGHGQLNLRDGLVWEIPMFGIFSPVLDAIVPGLGKTRARDASASFVLSNGIASSNDLELRAPALRMQYRGQIDLDSKIDARVEAEILRDTWMIGRFVSLALFPLTKLFEYRITGPLSQPKSEPVYIPKLLMVPLRPIQTLKTLFPDLESPVPPPSEKTEP
jgi:hypothetical protein